MSIELDDISACEDQTEFAHWKALWRDWIMLAPHTELPHGVKVVAYWIIHHLRFGETICYPGLDRLGTLASVSKSTAHDATNRLQVGGYLKLTPGHLGRGHSNGYAPILKGTQAELSEKVRQANFSNKSSVSVPEKFGLSGVKVRSDPPKRYSGRTDLLNDKLSDERNGHTHSASRSAADRDADQLQNWFEGQIYRLADEKVINRRQVGGYISSYRSRIAKFRAGQIDRAELERLWAWDLQYWREHPLPPITH